MGSLQLRMKKPQGYLEVIAGPMYCGKTEELIRLAKRATIGKKKVQILKHALDTRYGKDNKLFSHAGVTFEALPVSSVVELRKHIRRKTEFVGIDEAQWFGPELVSAVSDLVDQGKYVVIAGLAMTYDRKPFVPIPELMSMADHVMKLSAVCSVCGGDAVFHKRIAKNVKIDSLTADPALVAAMDDNVFEARCRACYDK